MQKTWSQYDLRAELAKKYSHSTYLASPTNEPDHQVVLTVFAASLFRFPYECENLLQKVQDIKDLQHSHLVPILDLGIEEGQPFVVREYLPNRSLRSYLKKISPDRLELKDALSMVSQVGQSLVYAHEHHIVHGNVKPENIFLNDNGQVVLTDFALISRKDAIIRDQTTEEYAFCYLAPEQFAGTSDARSDQYALGCLTYELITGRVPFAAQSLASMMGQSSYAVPVPLSQSVANLPAALEVAVLKALAQDPDERFFDFSLFLEVIRAVLSPPPAFPLLRSTYARKKSTISHPIPLAQPGMVSSPIRKRALERATSERPEPSETSSATRSDIREPAGADLFIDASVSEHTGTISAPESFASALQSQLFPSSLSPQTDLARTRENASLLPHPLKGQKGEEASALLLEAISPTEDLTTELATTTPITEEEPDDVSLTDPFVEKEEDTLPVRADASAVRKQHESETNKISSSLMIYTDVLGPQGVRTWRGRRRALGLVLVLSVILSLALAMLWPSGLFIPSSWNANPFYQFIANWGSLPPAPTSDRTGANLTVVPTPIEVLVSKIPLTSSPTATASSNLNASAANYNPNVAKASNLTAEKNSPNLYLGTASSNPSTGGPSSNPSMGGSRSNPSTGGPSSNPNTTTVAPTPTPAPVAANSNPYSPYSGTLALDDPLSDNSRGYGWQDTSAPSSNGGWACQFIEGAYHAIETQQNGFDSCHTNLQASNFALEVHMQIISGTCGGLVLRDTMNVAHAYSFQVCQDGSYSLYRFDGFSSGQTVQSSSSSAITTGLNQSNLIAAVANGSTFDLYVNNQKIDSINDNSYSQGQFGVSANGNSEAVYTNARMWTL